jgi:putative transposase
MIEIAQTRRRFGYRRIHDLLRPQFPDLNHKRLYRYYCQAGLAVRRRKKTKHPVHERVPLQLAASINEVWSMDFVSDSLSGGRRLKYLTVADDFTHESVDIVVDYGISGQYVTGTGSGGVVSWLSSSGADRQRAGVHQPGVHGLGAVP